MNGWAGGYVTDVEYVSGFYRQQSPPHLTLACLLAGVDGRLPNGTDTAHYMELGCGHGLNAVLIAASNPAWQVTAVDYNPAHIASGRALAREAGLGNVQFLEADFAQLADSAHTLPAVDVASMHGVWSWVSPAVRAGIVRLLAAVMAPGGLVHLSYNALPAWQSGLGMQRLIREAGQRGPGRSVEQVTAGLKFTHSLLEAKAWHLMGDSLPASLLQDTAAMSVSYLAHEYMNVHWSPCFHADVAEAMAGAKLDWAGPANLLESFPDLLLTPPQRALFEQFDDPVMRELVKDTCLLRPLRHDTFVRGARRLGRTDRDAALADLTLTLVVPAADFSYSLEVAAGEATLGPEYRQVVKRLHTGPAKVGELVALMPGQSNPAELAGVMVGMGQAMIVQRPGAEQAPGAIRLNRLLGQRIRSLTGPEQAGGLASAALGTGLCVSRLTQSVCARLMDGADEGSAEAWLQRMGASMTQDGQSTLRRLLHETAEKQHPVLRHAGVLPA